MLMPMWWSSASLLAGLTAQAAVKDVIVGLALFWGLTWGKGVARIMPSDLRWPGSCRAGSVPAPQGVKYANAAQKAAVAQIFKRSGCHSCGALQVWATHC